MTHLSRLHESGKAANVVGSLQAYIHDELGDVLNSSLPAIDFGGGLPFDDSVLPEWLQARVLAPVRPETLSGPFAARTGEGEADSRGQELLWLLNLNVFARPAALASPTNLRAWSLRDTVLEKFLPGSRIAVKDHAGEGETVGQLFVNSIMDDRAIHDPGRPELVQHNLVVTMRWVETWVVPE